MRFLHKAFSAKANDRIIIHFDKPTVIKLIHSSHFANFKKGRTYQYRGGHAEKSPMEFIVPFEGSWHAIIEKGTYTAPLDVSGSAELKRPGPATLNGSEQMETHEKIKGEYDDTLE